MSEESNAYPIDQISDPEIKMQLQKLQDKGSGALSPDKASEVSMTLLFYNNIPQTLKFTFLCFTSTANVLNWSEMPCLSQLRNIMAEMSTIYNTATVCKKDNPSDCQTLEPGNVSVHMSPS